MAANQVYDQLKALEINNTANYSVNASRSEVGNTLTGTTKTYSTLDAQGVESVNSVAEWSKANDNANQYFESVVSGEATGNFATQKGRVQNYIGNGFGLDSPAVDSKLFKAFDVDESVSSGYDKTYNFSTGSGETTSASDLVFDKTLISSERTSVSQNIKIPTFDATTQSNMGADLAAYNDKNQSNKVASLGEVKPIGGDYLSFGNDLNSEVITIPTSIIAAGNKVQVEAVDSESFASTFNTYDENSNGLFVVGTQPDAKVNTDPFVYVRDRKGQIITDTPAHNQLHGEVDIPVVDHSISGNNQNALADQLAAEAALKKIEKDAKAKAAEARQLEIYNTSVRKLAESPTDALGKEKEIEILQAVHQGTEGFAYKSNLASEDESLTFVDKGLRIIKDEQTLEEVVKERAEKERLAQQKIDAKFKRVEDETNPPVRLDRLGRPPEEVARTNLENDAQNNFTENNQYVNHHGPAIQQEIAEFEREDTLLDRHPTTGKTKTEIAAEKDARNRDPEFIKERAKAKTLELQAKQAAEIAALEKRKKDDKDFRDESVTADGAEANAAAPADVVARETKFSKVRAQTLADKKAKEAAELNKAAEEKRIAEEDANRRLIAGDPYAFSNLSYPYNVTNSNENGHYILFYVNVQNKTKYLYNTTSVGVTVGDSIEIPGAFIGGDGGPAGGGATYKAAHQGKGAAAGEIAYQSQAVKNGGKGNILRNNMKFLQKSRKAPYAGINSRYPTTTRITDSVALYLPTGIGNTTTATYGDSETGVAGYLALSGVDIIQDVKDLDFAGATDKLFGVGGRIITEAMKKIGIGAIEALTDTEGLTQSFDKIFGQTLNPYIEVTYTSFGMRTFDYTFQFAPESARESDEVKAIIQLFRFHMAPEMKGDAHRYLTLPSTFDIHYMFQSGMGDEAVAKENSFYNKIATCVLTQCDVNYTPDGVNSFDDGSPTKMIMKLIVKMTKMQMMMTQ